MTDCIESTFREGDGGSVNEEGIGLVGIEGDALPPCFDGNSGIGRGTGATTPRLLTGLDFKVVGGGFNEGKLAYGLEVVAYTVEGVKVGIVV